ncbi:MAG: PEPxxWA-CTERM sorting domain-containing protein [Nitrosospira sp.]
MTNTTWSDNTAHNNNLIEFRSGGGTISNTGTWNDKNAFNASMVLDTYGTPSAFHNIGTYNKQGNAITLIAATYSNSGTTNIEAGTLGVADSFSNSGVIAVAADSKFLVLDVILASAGEHQDLKSHTTFDNAATGLIRGRGTVVTPALGLTNYGAIDPGDSVGHLTIHGDLTQAASGVVNIELASLSSFDQLAVTHDVTLGGTLAVSNLAYTPVIGDSFVIMTFDERIAGSTFSSVSMKGFGSGVTLEVLYHQHDVTLAVTAVPEPESWAMLLAGLGMIGTMGRRRWTA